MPNIRLKNIILSWDAEGDHISVKPTKVLSDKFNFTRQDFALLGTKLERPLKKLWANQGTEINTKKTMTRKKRASSQVAASA